MPRGQTSEPVAARKSRLGSPRSAFEANPEEEVAASSTSQEV